MVIQEVQSPRPTDQELKSQIAHPVDRLAAFLVDFGVLFLTISVLASPFQKRMRAAQLLGDSDEVILWILAVLLVAGLVATLYQFALTAWRGATIGKLIFGLRVVDVWTGQAPGLFPAFVRGSLWWLSAVAGGLPYLAVYSDQMRRPLHDRVSNLIVISVRGRVGAEPLKSEQNLVTALFMAIYMLGFVVLAFETRSLYAALQFDDSMSLLEAMAPQTCEEVSEHQAEWPIEGGRVADRVSIAMALFAAGKIDEECLDQEAYLELRNGGAKDLAYLARAFSSSDESSLSDQYLAQVCEISPLGEPCQFSKLIDLWTEREWDAATVGFNKLLQGSSVYVKIWAIKHFEKIKDFALELQVIEGMWPMGPLADFLAAHRTVALWGLGRREAAQVTAQAAIEALPSGRRLGLASWICFRQTDSCEQVSTPFCQMTESAFEDSQTSEQDLVILTMARIHSCRNESQKIQQLAMQAEGRVQNVLLALGLRSEGRTKEAQEVLFETLEETDSDSVVHHESLRLLAEWSDNVTDLRTWVSEWKAKDRVDQFDWRELGRVYARRLQSVKEEESVAEIEALLNQEILGAAPERLPASREEASP